MKANELRRYNLVYRCSPNKVEIIKVQSISNYFINGLGISAIEPILIDEYWLLRFGFESVKKEDNNYSFFALNKKRKNNPKPPIDIYKKKTFFYGHNINHCKYVHQLQNLYFALTNTELEIKL